MMIRYGIKEIKGEKRISGEGLETADVPGIMQGGGKWPSRYVQHVQEGNAISDLHTYDKVVISFIILYEYLIKATFFICMMLKYHGKGC